MLEYIETTILYDPMNNDLKLNLKLDAELGSYI